MLRQLIAPYLVDPSFCNLTFHSLRRSSAREMLYPFNYADCGTSTTRKPVGLSIPSNIELFAEGWTGLGIEVFRRSRPELDEAALIVEARSFLRGILKLGRAPDSGTGTILGTADEAAPLDTIVECPWDRERDALVAECISQDFAVDFIG